MEIDLCVSERSDFIIRNIFQTDNCYDNINVYDYINMENMRKHVFKILTRTFEELFPR